MKHKKKIWILTFIMILSWILQSTQSLAATLPKGSISIVCPVEGMELSLYRVADYDEAGSFTLTGSFAKYAVSLKQDDQEGWQGAAYNVLEGSRDYLYTNSTGKLISHVNEQLSQINRRMGELESQAGTVNRTISRLNTDIRRYNRKINRRAE